MFTYYLFNLPPVTPAAGDSVRAAKVTYRCYTAYPSHRPHCSPHLYCQSAEEPDVCEQRHEQGTVDPSPPPIPPLRHEQGTVDPSPPIPPLRHEQGTVDPSPPPQYHPSVMSKVQSTPPPPQYHPSVMSKVQPPPNTTPPS